MKHYTLNRCLHTIKFGFDGQAVPVVKIFENVGHKHVYRALGQGQATPFNLFFFTHAISQSI